MQMPAVSIVIPTYNRARQLEECLQSIVATDYPKEIIVVDDGSHDQTREVCERFDVRYVFQENAGRSAARNAGIVLARHEFVVFTDDDCVVTADWLSRLMVGFSDGAVLGVSGGVRYVSDEYVPRKGERVVANPDARWPMTANIAYRKFALGQVGGFDELFDRYEDKELALRVWKLGMIAMAPDAVVYHQRTEGEWPNDRFIDSSASWVRLKKMHDCALDKNNPAPISFGFVLMPRQYGAIMKRVLRLPLTILQRDEFELRWLRFLLLERLAIWKVALDQKVFLV